jgi:hypothetical protein
VKGVNYITAAMRLLQRWTAWEGDENERRELRRESFDLMFRYTEPARLKTNAKGRRAYRKKVAERAQKKALEKQRAEGVENHREE